MAGVPADASGVPVDPSLQMQMNADGLAVEYTPEVVRKEMIVWGYIFGLIGSILLFGFYITVPIFLVVFLRFYAKARWHMAILLPAAVSAFLYVMLGYVFRMTLHIGLRHGISVGPHQRLIAFLRITFNHLDSNHHGRAISGCSRA